MRSSGLCSPRLTKAGAALAMLSLACIHAPGQVTDVSVTPEADVFVREAAPTNNYGRAGSLSIAGATSTNGSGVVGGRAHSLVRFQLDEVAASLHNVFGDHDWFLAGARLHLYEMGAPNNPSFNRGTGAFEVRWLAGGDVWAEGTGSPNAPTTDGIAFQDVASLVDSARDLSLGHFTNNGADGWIAAQLRMLSPFVEDLRAGGPITLHLVPTSESIGFTFLSRSDPRAELRTALELAVAAGPPPRITSIERTNATQIAVRFDTRSNWTHVVQYCEALSNDIAASWIELFRKPPEPFDSQAAALDATTNRQRYYRLGISQ